jgi:type IV pilus assembly protein PilW
MSQALSSRRGMTLLEVMIASAIGIVVLGVGLVVGLQVQRRALFEEQTMMAQSTGRALKDMLASDVQRAGAGMGNALITFGDGDQRVPIQVWTEPDLSVAWLPHFAADPGFALPPAGSPYAGFRSDVLRLYWGDTRFMVPLSACAGGNTPVRLADATTFCTAPSPPVALAPPVGSTTPAVVVNPEGQVACHVEISQLDGPGKRLRATPGVGATATSVRPCGPQNPAPVDTVWAAQGWSALRLQGAAYRVNWAGGFPTLEMLPVGGATWLKVSEDVERLKVRQAVIDLSAPNAAYRWFPDAALGRPAIDACTTANGLCSVDPDPAPGGAPANNAELRRMLQQRVRELEVTLVVRTQRPDRLQPLPAGPLPKDEEDFPIDGYKRRTLTFRVTPRNFGAAGRQPTPPGT